MNKITESDKKLLALLQANARMPLTELARKLGLARSTVQARLDRLENLRVIEGYGVRMGTGYSGQLIRATVLAEIGSNVINEVMSKIRQISEIERVSTTAGRFDLILELSVADLARLDEIIEILEEIEGFERSESLVHLSTRLDRRI